MSFSSDLNRIVRAKKLDVEKISRTIPLRVFGDVMKRTRVDTGLLRGNMQVTSDVPASGVASLTDSNEGAGLRPEQNAAIKPFSVTYLTNNLDYAIHREAADAMMGSAVADFKRVVREEAARL